MLAVSFQQRRRGGTWAADGTIIFVPTANSGLWMVSASGGTPEELTPPEREREERSYRWPEFLPGGNSVVFTVGHGADMSFDEASIGVLSLDSEMKVLIQEGAYARYAPTGHLLFARAGSIIAAALGIGGACPGRTRSLVGSCSS